MGHHFDSVTIGFHDEGDKEKVEPWKTARDEEQRRRFVTAEEDAMRPQAKAVEDYLARVLRLRYKGKLGSELGIEEWRKLKWIVEEWVGTVEAVLEHASRNVHCNDGHVAD